MLAKIIALLNSPYPKEDRNRSYYLKLAIISLFVAFFLFVFRPFRLDQMGAELLGQCLVFGLITFVVSVAYDLAINDGLKLLSKDETHVLWKWILNTLGLLVCIGVANFIYLHLAYDMPLSYLGSLITATFLVGVFPLFFLGMIVVTKGEQKYERVAESIKQATPIEHHAAVIELFGVASTQILYIEGLQNYVQVCYLDHDGIVQTATHRSTMKSLDEQLVDSDLQRCHRSYFVNKSRIIDVSGNAQGLRLTLDQAVKVIPVSRRFVDQFRRL